MMTRTAAEISRIVRRLVRRHGTAQPERLCRAMGIHLICEDMGTGESAVKAMTVVCRRIRSIVLNQNLPPVIARFVLAHELGHAVLHADQPFSERLLFVDTSELEHEANLFAAELLLGDSAALLEELQDGELTLFQLAAAHRVPYELIAYKLEILEAEGITLPELPCEPDSCFLAGMLGMGEDYSCWEE